MVKEQILQLVKQSARMFLALTFLFPIVCMIMKEIGDTIFPMMNPASVYYTSFIYLLGIASNMEMVFQGTQLMGIGQVALYSFLRVMSLRNDDSSVITEQSYQEW